MVLVCLAQQEMAPARGALAFREGGSTHTLFLDQENNCYCSSYGSFSAAASPWSVDILVQMFFLLGDSVMSRGIPGMWTQRGERESDAPDHSVFPAGG